MSRKPGGMGANENCVSKSSRSQISPGAKNKVLELRTKPECHSRGISYGWGFNAELAQCYRDQFEDLIHLYSIKQEGKVLPLQYTEYHFWYTRERSLGVRWVWVGRIK